MVGRMNHGGAELHGRRAPFPIAAAGAARERQGFAQQARLGRRLNLKILGVSCRVVANLLVNYHGEIKSELRGDIATTSVNLD